MVKDDVILSAKTVSDEKELNNIFGIENENISIVSTSLEIIDEKDVKKSNILNDTYFTNYYARKAIEDGLLDMEIWNKIKEFEKNNPDKIRKWREEEEERRSYNRINSLFVGRNKGTFETYEEKVIKLCLSKYPKSKFVISVSEYYKRYGKISDKQFSILKSMIGK